MKPVLTLEQYAIERTICDQANAYWKAYATFDKSGWSSLPPELAAHPDYAACNNDMRGRVEQFEMLRDLPEKLTAYIGDREPNGMGCDRLIGRSYPVTVWTGLQIGNCTLVKHAGSRPNWISEATYQCYAIIGGKEYTGRTSGVGMYVNLRETAASKRKHAA